ncbi:MAG: CRISPR-associated DxTHG motif protein [Deltaproteobacteria bacterium]|nr:CRISPR-associated DxTHG motif protein [Deltaproteobacteria bacterium]
MNWLVSMIGMGARARGNRYAPTLVRVPWASHAERPIAEPYHQHALLRALRPDRFLLVGTTEAIETHSPLLSADSPQPIDQAIAVPACHNEAEFWQMFDTLASLLASQLDPRERHEIHLDLTHGFRVQPMFLLAAVRYVTRLVGDQTVIGGTYYAIFDEDGQATTLQRVAPVLEMERIAEDVHALVAYSQPLPLALRLDRALRAESKRLAQAKLPIPKELSALRALADQLDVFGTVVGVNCTPVAADVVRAVCDKAALAQTLAGDLRPVALALLRLRDELQAQLPGHAHELWRWHVALARWCAKRGLLQQALTHAEELPVTRACEETGRDPLHRDQRLPVAEWLNSLGRPPRPGSVLPAVPMPDAWRPFAQVWAPVKAQRNDVNHAYTGRGANLDTARKAGHDIRAAVEKLLSLHETHQRLPPLSI